MKARIITFKGIKFYNNNFFFVLSKLKNGGYLVAPAASALANIFNDKDYYEALKNSNIAILDSGFFCILLRLFKKKKVKKFSGYLFLKQFLNQKKLKKKKILLVDPSLRESKINLLFFKSKNFVNTKSYVAPIYKKKIIDMQLLNKIKKTKPNFIIINIGGEVQEVLAKFIYKNLNNKTIILCTGAAIGFMTGSQAPINDTVDKFYLGWLVRFFYSPKKYLFRVIKSISLIKLFF